MGSKVLFIEADVETIDVIWNSLGKSGLLGKARIPENPVPKNFEEFNEKTDGFAIATSFEDAIARIRNIHRGEAYAMIFINSNLESYHDVRKARRQGFCHIDGDAEFTKEFFDYFRNLGDYLYFRFIDAGVPREKLCFFTDKLPQHTTPNEPFLTSPFVRHKPRVIDRRGSLSSEHIDPFEEKELKDDELVECLANLNEAATRARYREIFDNETVKKVFDAYLDEFITLLTDAQSDKIPQASEGITLRLMIEAVVGYIVTTPLKHLFDANEIGVRGFLNKKKCCYNDYHYHDTYFNSNDWVEILKLLRNWPSDKDKSSLESYFKKKYDKAQDQQIEKKVKYCIDYAETMRTMAENSNLLSYLYDLYSASKNPSINEDLPKYIFSYIDNIYTVTSELSAHGNNDMTTHDLSRDGWDVLLHGMCQIMQWVASQPPPQ